MATNSKIPGSVCDHKATGRKIARRNYKDADGLNKTFTAYADNEIEAWSKLKEFNVELLKGAPKSKEATGMTVGKLINQLEETVWTFKLRASTKRMYASFTKHHLDSIKDIKLNKLTVQDIELVINKPKTIRINCKGQSIRPMCARSKSRLRAFLVATLNHAVRLGYIDSNPAIRSQVHEKIPARQIKALSIEQIQKLFKEAGTMKTAYKLQATTGLRVGELLGLKWSDLKDDVLTITRQIQRSNGALVEQPLKTDLSRRKVALVPEIISELNKLDQKGEFIFCTESLRPIDPRNYNRSLEVDSAKAGIGKVTSHQLRHSFASIALQSGTELITVSRALGHSQLAVTCIYAETSEKQIREASDAVGSKLFA